MAPMLAPKGSRLSNDVRIRRRASTSGTRRGAKPADHVLASVSHRRMTRLILQVFQLPTYSPDYNPIEKLWKKIKQQDTHLHYFPTFEALTEKVEQALLKFANIPEEILALCSLPTALAEAA
jgi:transposase